MAWNFPPLSKDFVQIRTLQCCNQCLCSKGHRRFDSEWVSELLSNVMVPTLPAPLVQVLLNFPWQLFARLSSWCAKARGRHTSRQMSLLPLVTAIPGYLGPRPCFHLWFLQADVC